MIRGIIFDYDGVIGDSIMPVFKVHKAMMNMFGKNHNFTLDQFREMNNTDWKTMYRNWGFTEDELARLQPVFYDEIMKLKSEIRLFNGIEDVIRAAHKRFRLAIVSNGDSSRIREHLKQHDLLQHFGFIIGLEAERLKPDPYQLLACMKALDLKPSETCLVADTSVDIIAGRSAGVAKIIAVAYGYNPPHLLAEADTIVSTPQELLAALEELQ